MKDLNDLSSYLKRLPKKVEKEIIKAQQEVAKKIEADARELAPGNGPYAQSIIARETQKTDLYISTKISTTVMTDVAKSTGKQYNLGFLLETGTNPHAIPNAFDWGRIYGYDSDMYKRTLSKDWHPGFVSMPHFAPALNKNKKIYEQKIQEALRRAMK